MYNEAYVIVESNDVGQVVCNGLYYDLEYEHVHVESAIKSNAIGIEMTRKVKRLGCSAVKDILETNKLNIYVIDDGSVDKTPLILERLSREFGKLKIISRSSNAGGGKSGALNYALSQSLLQFVIC